MRALPIKKYTIFQKNEANFPDFVLKWNAKCYLYYSIGTWGNSDLTAAIETRTVTGTRDHE
jgi:hypothetical protein